MEIRRLYVDANILIMLAEGKGEGAELLRALFDGAIAEDARVLCTSELTLAEVLTHPVRNSDAELQEQYERLLVTSAWFDIEPVQRSVLRLAAKLRADHRALKLPDAIHVATALHQGCDHFLSGDERLPRRFETGLVPLHVIRPEAATLQQIIQAGHA
jgi:predicted nucleic acid-binding protein